MEALKANPQKLSRDMSAESRRRNWPAQRSELDMISTFSTLARFARDQQTRTRNAAASSGIASLSSLATLPRMIVDETDEYCGTLQCRR